MTTMTLRPVRLSGGRIRPGSSVLAASTRKQLWRAGFGVTGGLHVQGHRPNGGCVIVANHSSHADACALLAALPASTRPMVAAAQDHWFEDRLHRAVAVGAMGAFPVRRNGGGMEDLLAVQDSLRAGQIVVVFPEGTRSRNGELAEFRSGAFRLAQAAGVPIVPAGIVGARTLVPVRGYPRPSGVSVRFGKAIAADVPEIASVARTSVAVLVRDEAPVADSGVRRWVAELAQSPSGVALAFVWAMAEAMMWPLLPELALAILVEASPRSARSLAAAAVLGSVLGVMVTFSLARRGVLLPQLLTTPLMHSHVAEVLAAQGTSGIAGQALSGIPIKVYAAQAGLAQLPLGPVLLATLLVRGLRISISATLMNLIARATRRTAFLYPLYLIVLVVSFALALGMVVARWS